MPPFSLAALTALELPPARLVDVAAACAFEQVGFRLLAATLGGMSYPLMDDPKQLRKMKSRLDMSFCPADFAGVQELGQAVCRGSR